MIIKIENLRLRTVVGIYEWEKNVKQDVVINIELEFNGDMAVKTDDIKNTIDYKSITKRIIADIEGREYNLIEKIAGDVVDIIMEDTRVERASVRIDKPGALRFADSVSVTHSLSR